MWRSETYRAWAKRQAGSSPWSARRCCAACRDWACWPAAQCPAAQAAWRTANRSDRFRRTRSSRRGGRHHGCRHAPDRSCRIQAGSARSRTACSLGPAARPVRPIAGRAAVRWYRSWNQRLDSTWWAHGSGHSGDLPGWAWLSRQGKVVGARAPRMRRVASLYLSAVLQPRPETATECRLTKAPVEGWISPAALPTPSGWR